MEVVIKEVKETKQVEPNDANAKSMALCEDNERKRFQAEGSDLQTFTGGNAKSKTVPQYEERVNQLSDNGDDREDGADDRLGGTRHGGDGEIGEGKPAEPKEPKRE